MGPAPVDASGGYLEAGIDTAMATRYDPLRDNEPELARTMAASVTQRIACGERARQHVRHIGAGCRYEEEHPALPAPRWARLLGHVFALALAACPFVPS
jgi:hypothetical protein